MCEKQEEDTSKCLDKNKRFAYRKTLMNLMCETIIILSLLVIYSVSVHYFAFMKQFGTD